MTSPCKSSTEMSDRVQLDLGGGGSELGAGNPAADEAKVTRQIWFLSRRITGAL
jgi:hypothetical protein